jgi:3-hydroxyethyl bacteriochlorophyllide a dehydrogenase
MQALAIVLQEPERLELRTLALTAASADDVVVEVTHSGISTGTEKLLWQGTMPMFPGMGYPLVPGYESVGRVGRTSGAFREGQLVFVPGAKCFGEVRSLFGGTANRLVVPAARLTPIEESLGEQGALIALAATAYHAIPPAGQMPDLIVGHGVLGRLLARIVVANGAPSPTVWETNPKRQGGGEGYEVMHPDDDTSRGYRCICDASGDSGLLDTLVGRLAPGGEIVLAGFYAERLSFSFPPAFMREARMRIAAQFVDSDIQGVLALVRDGRLSLDGLITHRADPRDPTYAYRTAFGDADCLKMILDWSHCA